MNIPLQSVKSSQIAAVGYDASSETLAIQFHTGVERGIVYHYAPVPSGMYYSLLGAESIGRFFGQQIKGNDAITFTKVNTKEAA